MAEHTPGPWVHDSRGYPHTDVKAASGRNIAVTWGVCANPPKSKEAYKARTEIDRANARLIAAAPELLAACQAIVEYQRLVESDATTGLIAAYGRAFEGAVEAVAKATGHTTP